MRTILHISDLHFGRTVPSLLIALKRVVAEREPDLIIISGDLTQRATVAQFKEARDFLRSLPQQKVIVPGNHDVPLYSLWRRIHKPYEGYKRYIGETLEPCFEDEELIVVGLNTVRRRKVTEGHINQRQIDRVKRIFRRKVREKVKIIVSHHPFNLPKGHHMRVLSRARQFWKELEAGSVDLLLSGHLHDSLTRFEGRAYKITRPGPILIQAGTAVSDRTRWEKNSFNILKATSTHIHIERYVANDAGNAFVRNMTQDFFLEGKRWKSKAKQEKSRPRLS